MPSSVSRLIDSWTTTPAFVHGRHNDVLAANPLMQALAPIYRPGTNILRAAFLDGAVHQLFDDPEERLSSAVAGLRASAGPDLDDPRLTDLVGELSLRSATFRRLWASHDVRPHVSGGVHTMRHPVVGTLTMHYDKFAITGSDGQLLSVYQAEPGSPSEDALRLLGAVPS